MQVGSAHNPALNSILAASFAEAEFAAAARSFYISGINRKNQAQVDQRGVDANIGSAARSAASTQDLLQSQRVSPVAEQAPIFVHQQPLKLSDFQRPRVNLSAAAEAEIFGSSDMLGDNLSGDQAQRRSRFGQANLFQYLGSKQNTDQTITPLGNAPQYDLEMSADGKILNMNPRSDVTLGKPMSMPLIKDIETTMGQTIQGKVAALYAANQTAVESQGAYYRMVS